MRYKPRIGEEFPLSRDVIIAKTQQLTERTRSAIALMVVIVAVVTFADYGSVLHIP